MEYILNFSGGKDSAASAILAHLHNEPISEIICAEVMFDKNISGELPEHIDFIKNVAFPLFESWGYKCTLLHSNKTYMDVFHHIVEKPRKHPDRKGKKSGFCMVGKCNVQRSCKLKAINNYYKGKDQKQITQYVGIAIDEPKRLARLRGTNKISLLEKYGYTEAMAFELCKTFGLLSPIYGFAKRGGCWFCPNARYDELKHLRTNHRELWDKLLELEKEPNLVGWCWNTLTKTTMAMNEEMFSNEERQMTIFDLLGELENEPM